jgi:hypothetical protein
MGAHSFTPGHEHGQQTGLHEEFLQAIDDELAALDDKGADAIPVQAGKRIRHDSDSWWYRFQLSEQAGGLRPGTDIGFEAGSTITPGHVVARNGDSAVVSVDEDLGQHTQPGQLLVDSRWILAALRRRVVAIEDGAQTRRSNFNYTAAARALGIGDMDASIGPVPPVAAAPAALNPAQRRVAVEAHTRPVLYVWGPPGTGKTSSLHAAVCSLLASGLRVLFATPTNLAADAILERGTQRLRQAGGGVDGAILRLGPLEGVTLPADLRDEFSLHAAALRRLDGISMPGSEAYRQISARLVRDAKMVVTTIHQAYLSPLLADSRFDVVITDEASMIQPVALYLAAGLGDRAIIAGDFRQNQPVVHADSVSASAWLRRDAFEAAGIPDDVERGDYPPYLVVLTQQYRMREGICSLVAPAYDAGLMTDDSVLSRPEGPLGPHDVLYINSESTASVEVLPGGSRRNPAHVTAVVALLERLLSSGRVGRRDLSQFLIVTPFVAQVRLYDQVLREKYGRCAPRVRTAHRIQGREADIVLLDLVDAHGSGVSRFLSAATYRTEGGRMLTVAASRAREHLIVIADFEHLLHNQRAGRVVREFLSRVMSTGRRITARRKVAR